MYLKLFLIFFICSIISHISSVKLSLFKNIKSIYSRAYLRPTLDYIIFNKDTNIPIQTQEKPLSQSKNKKHPLSNKILEIGEIPEHLQEIKTLAEILNLIQIYQKSLEETDWENHHEWEMEEL
jgi:hypothetical protein